MLFWGGGGGGGTKSGAFQINLETDSLSMQSAQYRMHTYRFRKPGPITINFNFFIHSVDWPEDVEKVQYF